ncbi:MAG TPA: isochorismatase family protein, partial [Chitinivibrionales bacterium]|nr:isochorismatase family protein [Chitinivibrionales bacterium]
YPYKNSAELVADVNAAIHRADFMHMPVVVVEQELSGVLGTLWSKMFLGSRLMRGTPGAKTDARVVAPMAITFSKPKGDAFANPDLDRCLRINRINELYIAGVDAEFCVMLTARGAVNRGYKVTVIKDGTGLMNDKKWDEVIFKCKKYGIAMIARLPEPY